MFVLSCVEVFFGFKCVMIDVNLQFVGQERNLHFTIATGVTISLARIWQQFAIVPSVIQTGTDSLLTVWY